jgi:hypothetical protein
MHGRSFYGQPESLSSGRKIQTHRSLGLIIPKKIKGGQKKEARKDSRQIEKSLTVGTG